MHPHGVHILDGTDDDAVVLAVAHDFHLEFLPAHHGLFHQDLTGRRGFQPSLADFDELLPVPGNAAAAAPKGKRGTDDHRVADVSLDVDGRIEVMGQVRLGHGQPYPLHGVTEFLPVLRLVDGFLVGADHFHVIFVQHAGAGQVQGGIEARLPAHGRQQRVGAFLLDDLRDGLPAHRLDIGGVRHVRVGHNGCRVGIHQDHPVALLAQGLARLGAGIIELAGLADDDGAGADDQYAFYVGSFGHILKTESRQVGIAFSRHAVNTSMYARFQPSLASRRS